MPRTLLLTESSGSIQAEVTDVPPQAMPDEGDVVVRVLYSSLNYKDALAVTGKGKIVRGKYPFVPGIDIVGEIVESESGRLEAGDVVIATGWGIGEVHWGGYREQARLRSEWLVRLPDGMTPLSAMGIGTAGLTSMLAALVLEESGLSPEQGEVVVTGATGGVGSFSVLLLSGRGYEVVAATGKSDGATYLTSLGAARVIARDVLGVGARRPLDSAKWAGAVDSVGGKALEALLSQTSRHGVIAACGLAGGAEVHTTVFPFILRGVRLIGIDSNTCPAQRREHAWDCLAAEVAPATVSELVTIIELEDVPRVSQQLLDGKVTGRIVVRLCGV